MPSPANYDAHTTGVDLELTNLTPLARASIDTQAEVHTHLLDPEQQSMLEANDELEQAAFDGLQSSSEKLPSPSWLQIIFRYPPGGSLEIRPTSWLDGVRGVAALGVFIFHTIALWASPTPLWTSYDHKINLIQLPFVRTILISGGPGVCLFFVVSGYVLTYKCIGWLRQGNATKNRVIPAVASSAFRRGFRLYLPPILLTFCEMIATRFGIAPPMSFMFIPKHSAFAQAVDWVFAVNRFINPFYNFWGAIRGNAVGIRYDPVVWTIPLEYYGSLACYILLVSFVLVERDWIRMASVTCLSVIFLVVGCWSLSCFLAGMLIAELDIRDRDNDILPRARYRYIWWAVFALAFYVAGFPSLMTAFGRTQPIPCFETLRSITPPLLMEDRARFWWSTSSVAMMFCVSQLPQLRRIFESYFCQYLGKIAFSIYLLHAFAITLFGVRLQKWMLGLAGIKIGDGTPVYWVVGIVWYIIFSTPVFVAAGQFERWVDAPSVRFAKWLEEKCMAWWRSWKRGDGSLPMAEVS